MQRCEEDVNECEREECENGGACVNVFGSFVCNCTPGYVGQYCGLRPVVVPNIQAGHAYGINSGESGLASSHFLMCTPQLDRSEMFTELSETNEHPIPSP